MSQQKKMWESLYKPANQESQLIWHSEEIPAFLTRAVELLGGKGNVLDIGCGTGVYAVYMAQKGLQGTALDFVSRALEFARKRADKFGVNINYVQADVVDWKTSNKYELIFDSGCLHSIKGRDRTRYKEQILSWVSNQGSYILIHCGRKYFVTLNLRCPIRKTPQEIERFFCRSSTSKKFIIKRTGAALYFIICLITDNKKQNESDISTDLGSNRADI